MEKTLGDFREAIESKIEELAFGQNPPQLYEPLRYIMQLGGKRLRPTLTLLGYYAFKTTWRHILIPALATEVFHNFTLIHDDILDNAPIRRGKPTVHQKWNTNIAILSGDVMLVKAYEMISQVEDHYLRRIYEEFNDCITQVCEGQQKDMDFENLKYVSEAQYIDMIRQKTAVLLGFSMKMGAILSGTNQHNINCIYNFAVEMGIGFQIKDDWLDVFGDTQKVGKQVGGDIIANKKTFLLIQALELADDSLKVVIDNVLENQTNPEQKVKMMIQIYEQLGVSEVTLQKMNEHFQKALRHLDGLYIESRHKFRLLQKFAHNLMERES